MSWARSFGRFLGYVTAKLGIGVVKGKLGDKAGKVVDITKKAGVVLLAVTLMGASCREFGIGFGEGVVAGVADEFTPRPTPTRPPVVIEPTPTWTPNSPTIPDSSPTVTPHPPVPTPTLTPGPAPTATPPVVTPAPGAGCVPKPGPTPVTLIYRGGCPRYMEPLDFEGEGNVNVPGDKKLCAVKAGTGNGRTAWRLGYGLGRQGMRLERFGDAWLQFDAGRGCTDAYGRHFPDCETLYQHPEGPNAVYEWGGYTVPAFCEDVPTPTPEPTAGPTPTPQGPVTAYPCIVVPTVEFLGWNKPGIPPGVEVGSEARIDLTLRGARSPGDARGAACDKAPWTCVCEPERAPVAWIYEVPPGVEVKQFNNGYGLSLSNLQPGSYRITTVLQPGMLNACNEPVHACPWPHGGPGADVRDTLEFGL